MSFLPGLSKAAPVLGGAAGFLLGGGPAGAAVGASLGGGLGGMLGGGNSGVDPNSSSAQQLQYNKAAALYQTGLNRFNTSTPFGSQSWTVTGTDPTTGAPIYNQNISYSQPLMNAINGAMGSLPSSYSLPDLPVNPGQTGQDAIMKRLQPQIDLQNQQFASQMANQGIPVGSDAYMNAHRAVEQQQNDMTSQAALQGIGLDYQNLNAAIQRNQAPLSYYSGLMGSLPQFNLNGAQASVGAPNYQQALQNQNNAQTGSQNSLMSGLFSLGSAAMPGLLKLFGG